MPISGQPTGKGGAGSGNRLLPIVMSYGDSWRVDGAYNFGELGGSSYTHGIYVSQPLYPGTPPHSPVTISGSGPHSYSEFGLVETAAGVFTVPAGGAAFDLQAPNYPGSDVFALVGGSMYLHLADVSSPISLFPTEGAYYVVGVVLNTGGPTAGSFVAGSLIDFQVIYLQKQNIDIFSATVAGVNTSLLETALGLAGHNLKVRSPTFIDGLLATMELAVFDKSAALSTTPLTLSDDTGLSETHTQTTTPDSSRNVGLDVTEPD